VYAAFMGSPLEWSNFSHARLRHAATLDDFAMAATANRLMAATNEAERAKQAEQELALDKMETFTSVFRATSPVAPTQNTQGGET
jgi:hypothetical protein